MDLSNLDFATVSDQGAVIELYHPVTRAILRNEAGEPLTVTVVGENSERFQMSQRMITNRRLAAKGKLRLTAEELEAEGIETLAKCVIAWTNIMVDGETLACTPANVIKVLKDRRFSWLRKQVDDAVTDEGNFIQR